tara:strand:- start:3635 stop:4687 length:1053 start_codon:yes stop_codon:yes gene_type:complete
MDYFKIGKVSFSENNCVIIAEAGVNHNCKITMAEKLIKEAKNSGADIIKFQTYKADKLVVKKSPRFWKWDGEKNPDGTQYDSYSTLDKFNFEDYRKLKKLCDKYKIEFMSTPFDNESVDMLLKVGVKGFKIASCDITNFPLLKKVAKTKLPILLSTGASNMEEVSEAVKYLESLGNKKICIMHCTLCYPTLPKDANLSALNEINKKFKKYILGLSDHTLGVAIPSASVLYGVRVIEKHFTYNKKLKKSADHAISLNSREMKKLRIDVDTLMDSIGIGKKIVLDCEKKTRKYARRSLVANTNLKKGHVIKENDLIPKRPGTGVSPNMINKFIGKKINRNLLADEFINLKDI